MSEKMTRAQYESLTVAILRDLAKRRSMKGVSTLTKSRLIDALIEQDQTDYEQKHMEEASKDEAYRSRLEGSDECEGFIEVMSEGYGFIRSDGLFSGSEDIYVAASQIRKFRLRTGDYIKGRHKDINPGEKNAALTYLISANGKPLEKLRERHRFEKMTPVFPDERLKLEYPDCPISMRIVDLIAPIGKGQRGMVVSPPKAGKTTLIKQVAGTISERYPDIKVNILLIDERPEEVTDIREALTNDNVDVYASTFDETPDHHRKMAEMVCEMSKRRVEAGEDVIILLDSITRLARAYNIVTPPSGRTLSGGLDPAALHMPKHFFGAARNMREGGSLTILATALIETGSKMDDVIYEEFKGTGNMELVLNRKLQEKRIFPAVDLKKSGTRREENLLTPEEVEAVKILRRSLSGVKAEESTESILSLFERTKNNTDFIALAKKSFI